MTLNCGILLLIVTCCIVYCNAASLHTNKCSKEQPCANEGACVKRDGFYECVCPKDFSGDLCQTKQGNVSEQSDAPGSQHLSKRLAGAFGAIPPPPFKRVIQGQPALHPFAWPWVLSIKYLGQHGCGASLIADEWAVTAAHCFYDKNSQLVNLQLIDVVGGAKSRLGLEGIPFKIAEVVIHPWYIHNPMLIGPFDIALIRLAGRTLNFPFALLPASGTPVPNGLCGVAGWGHALVAGPFKFDPLVLQETPLPIQDTSQCQSIADPRLQLCAGGAGTSACKGDSGGPLSCFDNGVWVLEGITSSGRDDCFPFVPSVFTRVSSFVDWIGSTIAGR
ncbi:proproteinase E-like [Oculina patagonica]